MHSNLDFATTATRGANPCDLFIIDVNEVNGCPLTILITNGLIYKFWCALGEDVEIILWTKVQVSLGVLTSDHGNQNAEHSFIYSISKTGTSG